MILSNGAGECRANSSRVATDSTSAGRFYKRKNKNNQWLYFKDIMLLNYKPWRCKCRMGIAMKHLVPWLERNAVVPLTPCDVLSSHTAYGCCWPGNRNEKLASLIMKPQNANTTFIDPYLNNRDCTFPAVCLDQSAVHLNSRICPGIFYQQTQSNCIQVPMVSKDKSI